MGDRPEAGTIDTVRLLKGVTNPGKVFPPVVYVPCAPDQTADELTVDPQNHAGRLGRAACLLRHGPARRVLRPRPAVDRHPHQRPRAAPRDHRLPADPSRPRHPRRTPRKTGDVLMAGATQADLPVMDAMAGRLSVPAPRGGWWRCCRPCRRRWRCWPDSTTWPRRGPCWSHVAGHGCADSGRSCGIGSVKLSRQ